MNTTSKYHLGYPFAGAVRGIAFFFFCLLLISSCKSAKIIDNNNPEITQLEKIQSKIGFNTQSEKIIDFIILQALGKDVYIRCEK